MVVSFVGSGRGHCNAGGCGREGNWWPRGVITNGEFCCPTVVYNFDAPQSVLWVAPPSENGLTIEGDYASGITEDGDQKEVVDEAGQLVGKACVGG